MAHQQVFDTTIIAKLELQDLDRLRSLSLSERGALLAAVCRDAAQIEASRLKMGLPPSQPVPWPESTWKFLSEATRRVRER
jgi:hypothetical protein